MGQEQMISTQQPMAAKCTMKDKENWMFAHLTANSEDIHDYSSCQSEKGSGIGKSNGEEREQACI